MKIKTYLLYLFIPAILSACDSSPPGTDMSSPPEAVDADDVNFASAASKVNNIIGPIPGVLEQPQPKANPYAGDARAIQTGRELFLAYNCYGCHGGRAGGGMGPSLRDEAWMYGSSSGAIFSSIAQGRAHSMPAWGTKLPTELVWQLTAYIESLGSEQEPDRPMP